jgi:hypothetical protein
MVIIVVGPGATRTIVSTRGIGSLGRQVLMLRAICHHVCHWQGDSSDNRGVCKRISSLAWWFLAIGFSSTSTKEDHSAQRDEDLVVRISECTP